MHFGNRRLFLSVIDQWQVRCDQWKSELMGRISQSFLSRDCVSPIWLVVSGFSLTYPGHMLRKIFSVLHYNSDVYLSRKLSDFPLRILTYIRLCVFNHVWETLNSMIKITVFPFSPDEQKTWDSHCSCYHQTDISLLNLLLLLRRGMQLHQNGCRRDWVYGSFRTQ